MSSGVFYCRVGINISRVGSARSVPREITHKCSLKPSGLLNSGRKELLLHLNNVVIIK